MIIGELEMLKWINVNEHPYDACKRIAANFDSLSEWQIGCPLSYKYAVRRKWQRLIAKAHSWEIYGPSWIRKNETPYEACKRWAQKHVGLTDWYHRHRTSYNFAKEKGWPKKIADEIGWCYRGSWLKDYDSEYEACLFWAGQYEFKKEWMKYHWVSYSMAYRKGWLKEIYNKKGWEFRKELTWIKENETPYQACKRIAGKFKN